MNINQHFNQLVAQAAEADRGTSELLSQRDRLFKDNIIPALVKRGANDADIVNARTKWNQQTDKQMQSAGLLPKSGQNSRSFEKDKRAERAIKKSAETGSKWPIIKETIISTGENIGNTFGQGVGSMIEGAAGFVRDIGENEQDSIAAKVADYGKNLRKGYEDSASTLQKEIQSGEHGKIPQLASGAIQSTPAMALPFGAAWGARAAAAKMGATASAPYIGLGVGAAAGHTQNYGEVRRNATANLERDFPTWEQLQGNPVYEQEFQKALDAGVQIDQARKQAHATALDQLSENAADVYGTAMTALDFIAPSGAVLGSGILKKAPNSKISQALAGGKVNQALVSKHLNNAPKGVSGLIDTSLTANMAAAKMVGKQALEEGLQGAIGEYGAQSASANIGGQAVNWGDVGSAFLEEAVVGGVMGGGMQSASRATPNDQAKDVATQLRNQTNRLRQEEAQARQELSEATQLGNPDAIADAQANLNNIGAEALKVKEAYTQYGQEVPYFVDRFAAQYQPKVQPQAAQQPPEMVEPMQQPQEEQPAAPSNSGPNRQMASTTNLVMKAVSHGVISVDEANAIQSDPLRGQVFDLSVNGDKASAHGLVMQAVSGGQIDPVQAQDLIASIDHYASLGQPAKPKLSSIVDNHVKSQIEPQGDIFGNAIQLDSDFEPVTPGAPSFSEHLAGNPDFSQPKIFSNPSKANQYIQANKLQGTHEAVDLGDGTITVRPVQPQGGPELTDFGYGNNLDSAESNLADGLPEVIAPVENSEPQGIIEDRPKANFEKPKVFNNYVLANYHIKENKLKDTHEIVKLDDGRAEVRPKQAQAPEADVNSDEAFDDLLNAVPPIGTPAQNTVEPVQAADPATDFDSDEAFDELLNAVPPIGKQTDPAQPAASFADQIRDAHLNNPKSKAKLINDEVAKGRPRHEVLAEVQDVVKGLSGQPQNNTPVTPESAVIDVENLKKQQNPEIEQKADESGIQENDAPDTMKPGDIGRGSDGKPYLSRNAALRGLKNNNVKDTHEIVELAPSKFVLRAKEEAPAPEATAIPEQTPAKDPLSFPLARVKEAYGHAHLSPGNTAKSFKESFDKFIQAEIDEAQPLATTDEQKAALNEAIDWVKDNYINKALPPLLNAASATVSSARAGRNNFNSKQANQRGSALDKATDKFNAELEQLKGYAKLKVLAARTPKQKQADAEAAAKAEQEKLEAEQAKQEAKANKKRASNANLGSPEGAEQMTAAEWRAKHKDSKSVIDGVRYVMKLVNGATSLVPVWITDEKGTTAKVEAPAEADPAANSYESVKKSFDDVVSRLDDGDESLTLDDVKTAYNALMDNHDSLVADLSKQTKSQLLEKMHPYYAAMYKSYKKDELVNKWVNNIYRGMDFGSNGVVTISYGDKRTMAEIVRDKIEAATQEDLNKYLEERRQAVAERQKELEAAEAGMNDPKTLDDFRRINAKGDFKRFKEFYRSLTVPQQALYDELKSAETNEARMQEIERNKAYREASRPSQAVESTTEATLFAGKHTKKGTDIWTVALNGRVDGDAFNDYRSQAKVLGGYYSSYKGGGAVPGFIFDNEAAANEFLNLVTGDHEANSTDPEPEAIAIDPEAEVEVIETDAKRQADKLREKAQAIIERGEQSINRERKTNTIKRAGEAARAEEQANKAIFLGETLNRVADGIENGTVKYLSRLGAMTQLGLLESLLQRASYDQQRETNAKEREINATTIAYVEYPQYKTWIDSFKDIRHDLRAANPRLADKLEKAISTRYHNAYSRWLNETNEFGTENYVGQLARKVDGTPAVFKTNIKQAESLVKSVNKKAGKEAFVVFKIKNGEYAVISSYETAMENGSWKPTNSDKQMTLTNEFGHELYNALKQYKRKKPSYYMNWFIESMNESVSRMEKLGIHDPATFRAAMREYLGLRSKEKANDPIKELERSMVGRTNDGLDFFPTPRNVVEQMIEMADLDSDMKVLEPSAGMGHIADVLKDHGIQPDVIELSDKRQELLRLKGYNVVGNDFLTFDPKNRAPNYGDVFKTADGKYQGIMRGSGSLGSNRVRLMREDDGQMITYFDRDELELVKMNGVNYDRIIMNPPFSDRRDAAHIYHAFDLLADDGVMVAIAGEGVFFGKDKAAKEFQEWLDNVGAEVTPLDAGTFNDPSLPVTTGVKARIIKISKADSKGKLFSRSENLNQAPEHAQNKPSGSTPDQVRAELKKRFGDDVIQQLEDSGLLIIEQTYSEPGVEGFAENGRVTLIADAITAENIVPVFLHELGGHIGLQGVLMPQAYENLMKDFNRLVAAGDPTALEAKRLAERESDAGVQADEYLPYLITVAAQQQAKQGPVKRLVNRIVSAVKAWAVDKLGVNLQLNANDILALAERMVKQVPKHTPPTGPKGGNKAPSVDAPIDRSGQTETAAFKTWFKDSKVVDASGKPLVMYHGTPKSFSKFNTDESGALLGKGSYFTANMADAAAYAGSKAPMQTYLSIQNPHYVNSVMDKVPSRQELKDQGHDGVILLNEDKSIKWAVAHKPAQIKSATANTGAFDSSNPDIRYSRSSNPQNMSRSRQREFFESASQTALGEMALRNMERGKTLSRRTLNLFQTMLHKALTDESGQFKKTFDLVQGKINHVTFMSSKSMDAAPSVLTQLEEGSDYWKEAKRVGKTLAHKGTFGKVEKAKVDTDLDKVGKVLFENTLTENSERHTEKELRQLGFDQDQIDLYMEIRESIDTSLDTFANTTFSNIYKHLGGTTEEVLELAGRNLDITDHYNEVLKMIDKLTKGKPEKADARQAAIEAIDRVYKKANDLKDQGYVPLMRFGKYFVRIYNPTTGEVAYRQHFESESERNMYFRERERQKDSLPAGFVVEKGQINELQHKLFQGISPETVALFAQESGLPIGDAETAYIKYAVQNNHALKRLLKRQGIDGFDTDIKRVLASFVLSNARYSANQTYNPAIDESITEIEDAAYQEDAIRLRDYALDTQEELSGLKNFAFVWYMGFSVMFGLVNLTQPLLQTFPYLMQYSKEYGVTGTAFLKAINTWRKGADHIEDKYKVHYEKARKEGHLDPQNTWMLQGLERGKSGLGASVWQLISHSSGMFAQASETVNRRTTLFAALDVAESLGPQKLKDLGFKDAYDFAVRAIQETQGIYNKGNRPRVSRGNVGSMLMMYKQFMIAYIEQMARMQKSGLFGGEDDEFKKNMAKLVGFGISRPVLIALGILMSLSGATGLPFVRDILDGVETVGGMIGKPVNTEREVQIALHNALGATLGGAVNTALMDGFVNLQPIVDVKGRMGMGDLIPATAYFSPTTSEYQKGSEAFSLLGSMGGLVEKANEAVQLAKIGAYGQAGVQLLPKAATSLGQGGIAAVTGDYRNMKTGVKTNEATVLDGVVKMLDAQPSRIAKEGRVRGLEMRDRSVQQYVNARWRERYEEALSSGDTQAIREIKQQIRDYNATDPRYPVTFNQKRAETNHKKANQKWQDKRKNTTGLEWMDQYNPYVE